MRFVVPLFLSLALLAASLPSRAQESQKAAALASKPAAIQDDSFLVEEAYNQEDGVIQHISFFQRLATSRDWVYTQTDEWPLRSYKHQLSFTLSGTHAGDFQGSGAGWGDTAINYRYQLVGNGQAKLAVAPRLSLLIPTGDYRQGHGYGGAGLQTNIPISIQHSQHFVTHWNAGATWVPKARNALNQAAGAAAVNVGQSVVWLASSRVNFLVETLWTNGQEVTGPNRTAWTQDLYINPGIRWAYNFKNGLQIVPGLAMPLGVGPSAGEKGFIMYLSFEHPCAFAHSRMKAIRSDPKI
jgi:hypothetical protein